MASNPPPPRPDEELAVVADPDFGPMRLVRRWFGAMEPDGQWAEHSMEFWDGALGGANFNIQVDAAGPFPEIPAASRAVLVRIGAEADEIRRDIASRMLDLAKHWAESGDLPEPTLESLFGALTLTAITTYEDWAPTLYFEERGVDPDDAIFAGHVIEVRCGADGAIREAHIAG